MTRRPIRALRGGAVALAVAVALTACVSIPTRGPVGEGVVEVNEPAPVTLLGYSPEQDASPMEIVQGFLNANAAGYSRETTADVSTTFSVAREYLSGEVRSTWNPNEQVIVYPTASSPEVTLLTETQVQVKVGVAARIDASGVYEESAPGSLQPLVFDLVKDSGGQWRISRLDNGVVLSEPNFELVFRQATIYFLSADNSHLVPETRWFPVRNLATSLVRALMEGPSPWLRDAVRTAVPDGVQLETGVVLVDADGTAEVSLSGAALGDAEDRARMLAQLEATLDIARVNSVEVLAGGVPLAWEPARLVRGSLPSDAALEVVQDDTLMALGRGELAPVAGVGPLTGLDVTATARNEAGSVRVVLSGGGTLVRAASGGGDEQLLEAAALAPPSVDRLGWVWTASAGPEGPVITAVRAGGAQQVVRADWLAGRTVHEVRVARDGTRVAVLSTDASGFSLDVAGVVRDQEGTPLQLGEPIATGATLTEASRVVWVDESTLGVLGKTAAATATTVYLVPLAGQTRALPALEGIVALAGGKGERALYVTTSEGELYVRSGPGWAFVADGVRAPSFPG
ncbi:LpqB family beta-propeller domain-containing protein [Cellulomonas cellasea]|uniref:LpqB family beta-propeller domain-containing protein n=1 Tax=Cellulomonas cellasea TaxID=43670 RepID=UPI0025A3F1F6|nr:LpqB family beta-propeller domain-containing protein [Cellulomonas cellasea]MDM8083853.1 LpqB family beta-propeller domain-containing protein [Cellulomonas cellasea]